MKRIVIGILPVFILCALISAGCHNKPGGVNKNRYALSDTIGKAVITFADVEHDFGTIKEGERVAHIFSFTNTGDADLIITSVLSSCGCTVPKFDKKPIAPGGNGVVEVAFDSSDREGHQTKTITVQSNAENKIVILRITGEVLNSK